MLKSFNADVKTVGIKYAGSKKKIIPNLISEIQKYDVKTVLDAFSGSTRVSQALALCGYNVICNDVSCWSEVFGKAFLYPRNQKDAEDLIAHLNAVKPIDGWFTEKYGGEISDQKKVWQKKNTRKLDAIRDEIDKLDLSDVQKSIALTALIFALDKVDSTLGHFTSYLRDWSARSHNDLRLLTPRYQGQEGEHLVTQKDILKDRFGKVDLAYFDPPYGSNNEKMPPSRVRYASYYHLWTTIIKNDRPDIFGAASRRTDTSDKVAITPFEEFKKGDDGKFIALKSIDSALDRIDASYIILSYSSGGRATASELADVIASKGKVLDTVLIDYKKHIMTSMKWTNEWVNESKEPHKEFLFVLQKE